MNKLTDFYKVLSDETRIRILMLLRHKKLCVCQLCEIMEESQPKISKHLAKLRDMGLIDNERSEQFIFYSLSIKKPFYLNTLDILANSVDDYSVLKNDLERCKSADQIILSK